MGLEIILGEELAFPLSGVALREMGKMMANAMSRRVDFDAWWMVSGFKGLSRDHCHKCLRPYRRDGWLLRHYRKTGHWEE